MNWTDLYTAYLEADWRTKQQTRKQDCFHCSEIGYCRRKAFFRRNGEVYMPDPGRLRRLRQGTVMHEEWERAAVEALQGLVDVEVDLEGHLPAGWVGTTDCVLTIDGGEIVDWKTMNADAFRYRAELPKMADCLQLGLYWGGYEHKYGVEIERGKVVYVPLGGMDDPEECLVDPSWKGEALLVAASFNHDWEEYLETGDLPEPPAAVLKTSKKNPEGVWQQSWECSPAYCDYRASGECSGGPDQP